jgi:hypothetical protein
MATTTLSLPSTMKAVVFDGLYKISVQDRPMPQSKLLGLPGPSSTMLSMSDASIATNL